ncbi:MAG: helicase C-terminal domain-containing protein [Bacillota bacterium]
MDNRLFTEDTIKYMKAQINDARGQEVFFQGAYDGKQDLITSIRAVSRGNESMAPAIISNLKPGDVVIHNHPSGDLRPSAADIRIASKLGNQGIGFIIVNNELTDSYLVVSPDTIDELELLDKEEIIKYFKPGGQLANFLDNYQERKEQIKVLEKIIDTFNNNGKLMVEAGTGTGKSFAYLIPALIWSMQNNVPVIISTNTINLQQQLINKDLVFLKEIMPFDFKATLVKGRSNYICYRKLKNILKRNDNNSELKNIAQYIEDQTNSQNFAGSKSDLTLKIDNNLWSEFASESDMCLNSACPYLKKCYFQRARKSIYQSDILVVNHHLLLADGILKNKAYSVLPDYQELIIDEAHNLSEVATKISGQDFYPPVLNNLINRIMKSSHSPLIRIRKDDYNIHPDDRQEIINLIDQELFPALNKIEELNRQYNYELGSLMKKENARKLRLKENTFKNDASINDWKEYGNRLISLLKKTAYKFENLFDLVESNFDIKAAGEENPLIEINGYLSRLNEMADSLEVNLNYKDHLDEYVFWIEQRFNKGNNNYIQRNAKLEVNEFLNEVIFEKVATNIMTSATLAVNESFDYFKKKMGLSKINELIVESPFDYENQIGIYLPDNIPSVYDENFLNDISDNLIDYIDKKAGRTLILFTSYKMLNQFKEIYKDRLKTLNINILAQGDLPRHIILKRLKNKKRQILLGTSSFWEGIDVQGNSLAGLVIMKLPFEVPTDPIIAARNEKIKESGGNPFWEESLPAAIIKFKQGFGRLIRSKNDQGEIILLDRRILDKSYGSSFLNSLPKNCEIKKRWPKFNIKK